MNGDDILLLQWYYGSDEWWDWMFVWSGAFCGVIFHLAVALIIDGILNGTLQ
jgi:hypothetical protein